MSRWRFPTASVKRVAKIVAYANVSKARGHAGRQRVQRQSIDLAVQIITISFFFEHQISS